MTRHVLDIGNCDPDHRAIRQMIEQHFHAQVLRAHGWSDAAMILDQNAVDLVLINRILDRDGSEGLDIIRQIKGHPKFRSIPCMLITNYAEHQQAAVREGACPGFGKAEMGSVETIEKLRAVLESGNRS